MLKRVLLAITISAPFLAMSAQASDSANLKPNHATAFAEGLYAKPGSTASGTSIPPPLAASDSALRSASTENRAVAEGSTVPQPVTMASPGMQNGERPLNDATMDRSAKPEEGAKWSDILLAAATLLLTVFTASLWWSTRGLLIEAKRAGTVAENSAKAAQASAEAAANTVKAIVAREQPRWLVAEMAMKLHTIALNNPQWTGVATVTLRNVGRTIAEVTETAIGVGFGDPPPVPDYARCHKTQSGFGSTVVPDANKEIALPLVGVGLDAATVQAVSGGEPVWLYGYVVYRDYLDREWIKGFIGFPSSAMTWYPTAGGPDADRGGGRFDPPAFDVGLDAYIYTRLVSGQE